jgi:hypothetical protein
MMRCSKLTLSANISNFDVCKSVELVEGCHEFPEEYKENGLQRAISAAMELANELQAEPEFQSVKRVRHVEPHFGNEAHDEPVMASENKFEIEFYKTLLDTALMSVKERFEQLHQHAETCCFLYRICELLEKRTYKTLFRSSVGFDRWFGCRYQRSPSM